MAEWDNMDKLAEILAATDNALKTHLFLATRDNLDLSGGSNPIYRNSWKLVTNLVNLLTDDISDTRDILDKWLDCNESIAYCINLWMQDKSFEAEEAGHFAHLVTSGDDEDYTDNCRYCRESAKWDIRQEMLESSDIGRSSSDW